MNTANYSFEMELSGRRVTVQFDKIAPAEPDVGIMSEYPDGYEVIDNETGCEVTLTRNEELKVGDKIGDYIHDLRTFHDED
jgi:hypothetical protein